MQIYVAKSGQQTGPFSLEQVQSMLDSGAVVPTDLAWYEGMASWLPLRQVLDTISAQPTASQLPPLPQVAGEVGVWAASEQPREYAPFLYRLGGCIIDAIVLLFVVIILDLIFGVPLIFMRHSTYALSHPVINGVPSSKTDMNFFPGLYLFASLIGLICKWLYFALMESSTSQATLGKMACGMVVTDMEGKRISFARASGRFFGKYISAFILGIGYLMCIWTEKKQCLHDMMAGCLVIMKQ